MLILSADLLLWLNAVTEDTIHTEIELEKEDGFSLGKTESLHADLSDAAGSGFARWGSSGRVFTSSFLHDCLQESPTRPPASVARMAPASPSGKALKSFIPSTWSST